MLKHWKDLSTLPPICFWLAFIVLINRMGTMVLPFLTIYLTREGNFTPVQAGIVLAAYGIGALITSPVSGRLSDRFGFLPVMASSFLGAGVTLLIFPFLNSYTSFIMITFIFALFNDAARPACMMAFSSLTGSHQKKQAFVLLRLAINLGMSIGPAVGGVLAGFHFRSIFYADAFTSFLAFAVLLLKLKPYLKKISNIKSTPLLMINSITAGLDPTLLIFCVAVLLECIILFQHESTLPLFVVQHLKLEPYHYGLIFTVNTTCILLFEVSINYLTKHWPLKRCMQLSSFFWAIGFGALAWVESFWGVIGTVLIWTMGEMIGSPAQSAYVSELAPQGKQGSYLGFYSMTCALAYSLGPWLGTNVLQLFGFQTLWFGAFFLGLIAVFIFSRLPDKN